MSSGGTRPFGTWVPAAVMKNIDTESIIEESRHRRLSDMVFGFAYLIVLALVMSAGLLIGFVLRDALIALLVSAAFGLAFVVLFGRLKAYVRERRRMARYLSEM